MTNSQIDTCPYCGNSHIHINGHLLNYRVVCPICQASGPRRRSQELAIGQWNHQARELCFEKQVEGRQLLTHLKSFGDLPPHQPYQGSDTTIAS